MVGERKADPRTIERGDPRSLYFWKSGPSYILDSEIGLTCVKPRTLRLLVPETMDVISGVSLARAGFSEISLEYPAGLRPVVFQFRYTSDAHRTLYVGVFEFKLLGEPQEVNNNRPGVETAMEVAISAPHDFLMRVYPNENGLPARYKM